MPFKSKAQQRYLESDDSPLSDEQKEEWESATDFSKLPETSNSSSSFSSQMSRSKSSSGPHPRPARSGPHQRGSHRPPTFHVPGLHVPSTDPKIQRVKNH